MAQTEESKACLIFTIAVVLWTIVAIAYEFYDQRWGALFVHAYGGPFVNGIAIAIGIGYLLIRAPKDWALVLFTAVAVPIGSTVVIYMAPFFFP